MFCHEGTVARLKHLNDLGNRNQHVSKLVRCINIVYSQANVLLEHWKQSHTQNAYSEIIFNISIKCYTIYSV